MANDPDGVERGADASAVASASDEVTIVGGAARQLTSADTEHVNVLVRPIARSVESLWELMTTEPGSSRWLGSEGPPVSGVPFACPDASQFRGVVGTTQIADGTRTLYLELHGRAKPVRVSLIAGLDDTSILHIEDQLMSFEPDTRKAWVDVAGAIADCHEEVVERAPRQAVIVVHGIGEQREGETIKDFIDPLLGPDGARVTSYPHRRGDGSDQRRYRAAAGPNHDPARSSGSPTQRPETDFYEYYWAHYVGGTTLFQVLVWIARLLFRWPTLPHTRVVWGSGWVLIAGVIAGVALQHSILGIGRVWLTLVILLVVGLVAAKFLKGHVGDAARYLGNEPYNVDLRNKIRFEGISLLDRLHESRDYDRIVVVGHSLGSVVAYDMLRHYWSDVYDRHGRPAEPLTGARLDWERTSRSGELFEDREAHQAAQRELWAERRVNGHRWLVSDFVTLGSPLAHAELLLADSAADLERQIAQLELPTCPPPKLDSEVADSGTHARDVKYRVGGETMVISILNHGAVFAPTRWTNLFYSGFLVGDPVGGPIASSFGEGVVDIAVSPGGKPKHWSLAGHSKYGRGPALNQVLRALDLGVAEQLAELNAQLPVGALLKPPSEI